MTLSKNLKKFLVSACVIVSTLFSCVSISNAATTPVINSLNAPVYNGVYFQSPSVSISANVSNSPTSVYWLWDPPYAYYLNSAGGTLYSGTWTTNNTASCRITSSSSGWAFPGGSLYASNSAGSTNGARSCYVTSQSSSFYYGFDSSFYYNSATSTSIIGTATPASQGYNGQTNTYNCLAYATGNTSTWAQTSTSISDIDNYMFKQGSWSSRPGSAVYSAVYTSVQPWTKAIYYSGYHFAKVTGWDANGNPVKITSKWGSCELVNSNGINVFSSSSQYGTATRFYK